MKNNYNDKGCELLALSILESCFDSVNKKKYQKLTCEDIILEREFLLSKLVSAICDISDNLNQEKVINRFDDILYLKRKKYINKIK